MRSTPPLLGAALLGWTVLSTEAVAADGPPANVERHLAHVRQLTHGGQNAEAYFSADGTRLERVTFGARFDSFAMFSKDGKTLVFASSRGAKGPHEFNIFVADWVE